MQAGVVGSLEALINLESNSTQTSINVEPLAKNNVRTMTPSKNGKTIKQLNLIVQNLRWLTTCWYLSNA
jgi:hypothetical protein